MAQAVQPGGYVLLSGITEPQAWATTARYASLGFVLEKRILLDGWAALLLGRRNASTLFD
jgi:ribosomal protein L11 methyltransferase